MTGIKPGPTHQFERVAECKDAPHGDTMRIERWKLYVSDTSPLSKSNAGSNPAALTLSERWFGHGMLTEWFRLPSAPRNGAPISTQNKTMKIAVNKCYGGFSVSKEVFDELGLKWDKYGFLGNADLGISSENYDAYRADPRLIAAIEKVGEEEASGSCAHIKIVEIPDGVDWECDGYDGMETIHEKHRSW